jgi:chromosome segregation protein
VSRLKELRLHGFKSFADPTRFVFEPGVNAVIGPNGSGKSNMADAVRWVLGEQSNRSLRTRRADDVIFAGSEQRRAQGMAEAILTLDNADGWLPIEFAEVAIGRRAYRSGDGEYLINGTRARLRDVVELLGEGRLGANELVVVGQGTVDAALSLRPEERRQLFEEAAGVKGLQVRRNEASVRLARALDNLTRVSDVVAELKPQVRRLALQAEHQQQHDTLGARARGLVVASHARRERQARAILGEARRAAAAAESELTAFREAQDAGRKAVGAAEERYWQAEEASRQAARGREATREALIRAESRAETAQLRVTELRSGLEADQAELGATQHALAGSDDEAVAQVAPALAQSAEAEEAWRSAVASLAAADDELLSAEQTLAELRSRTSDRIAEVARASEEEARRTARRDQAEGERQRVSADHVEARAALDAAAGERGRAEAAAEEAARELDAAATERDTTQADADGERQTAVEVTERLRALRAELAAVEEPKDAGVRLGRRLVAAGWASMLESIEAPEDAWPAIEAVVGGELEGALLWSDDGDPTADIASARGAAHLLDTGSHDDAGRATALAAVGADRTVAEWVGAAQVPVAFRYAVVARDLDALLAGWRGLPAGWSAVTREGDFADARGIVVLHGRADPPGGAAARAHARRRELRATIERLETEATTSQDAAHRATERLRRARDAHIAAGERHDGAERTARRAREELDAAEGRVSRLEAQVRQLDVEVAELDDGTARATPDGALGDGELERLQERAREARRRRDELAGERDAARERWTVTRTDAEALETATATRRRDRALHEARVAQLTATLPAREASLVAIEAEHAALAAAANDARTADRAAQAEAERSEADREARRGDLRALERDHVGTASRLAELEKATQEAAIEASRRDEALAALARERELALEGIPDSPDAAPEAEIDALDDEALEAELRRVRRTLAQIGSVNPFAVEEHREVASRMEEMTAQHDDLRAAITSTEELMAHLDRQIGEQFDAAFQAIAERFDEYCQLLFAGGSASLQLADEADGDAPGGIEIVVRPPGKRLQRLAMLSGGERALTGVALLFAMLTVNPVPFCILDEVDAALDEANIGRFADALRRLAETIDFVVITHNRATIEVADTIYGVTMTDEAVSRVLSLRLSDVPVEVGA